MKKLGYKQLCLIIPGLILFQALLCCLLSFGCYYVSTRMDSYIEVPAYIDNVWEYGGGRTYSSKYEYTIYYTYNGEEYKYRTHSMMSPDEDLSSVWLNPETMYVSENGKESFVEGFWGFGLMAIAGFLAAIISFVVLTITGKKQLQRVNASLPAYSQYYYR